MSESKQIVELIIGHTSSRLPGGPSENGHTHQWTLFVKPANKEYENFTDNKLVHKVKFEIHESFPNPVRIVSKPPFKISETGFASFSAYVSIYLNLPHQKPHRVPYELILFNGETDSQEEVQKLLIREDVISPAFLEQIKKYGKSKKRKASMISSHSGKPSSPDDSWKNSNNRSYKKSKEIGAGVPIPKIEVTNSEDNSNEKRRKTELNSKPKSAAELTKKLNKCSDPHAIYKISEFLLKLPKTTIHQSSLHLSFDLTGCDLDTLSEISKILKSFKNSRH